MEEPTPQQLMAIKETYRKASDYALELATQTDNRKDIDAHTALLAFAISYAALAVSLNANIHDALEIVMTMYKHQESLDEQV